ncbi:hypothetical protein [Kineococcus esterisolvens]|uniref:hypothetical protein n=1 Tax=unclassified Kineococcus TaxID=2621656 RepID=UPI003D7E368C
MTCDLVVAHRFDADLVLAAPADPAGRDTVTRVVQREASVRALAGSCATSFAAVQEHVAVPARLRRDRAGRLQDLLAGGAEGNPEEPP